MDTDKSELKLESKIELSNKILKNLCESVSIGG